MLKGMSDMDIDMDIGMVEEDDFGGEEEEVSQEVAVTDAVMVTEGVMDMEGVMDSEAALVLSLDFCLVMNNILCC